MRRLISDILNGACFAALVVATAAHGPRIVSPTTDAAVSSQASAGQTLPHAQTSTQSAAKDRSAERETILARTEETRAPVADTQAASGAEQKSDAAPLSRLPSFSRPEAKTSGGLGAAADGGIDAIVPPIVRQRPVTPPLTITEEPKRKEKIKVKAATGAKSKGNPKQALGATSAEPVRR